MDRMEASRKIDIWCNKADSLRQRINGALKDFENITESYSDIRYMSSNLKKEKYNAAKERIDDTYRNLEKAHRALCTMKAGRRSRQTRFRKSMRNKMY